MKGLSYQNLTDNTDLITLVKKSRERARNKMQKAKKRSDNNKILIRGQEKKN